MGHKLVSHGIQSNPQLQLTTQIMITRALQFEDREVHLNLAFPPTPFFHWETQSTETNPLALRESARIPAVEYTITQQTL